MYIAVPQLLHSVAVNSKLKPRYYNRVEWSCEFFNVKRKRVKIYSNGKKVDSYLSYSLEIKACRAHSTC